MASRRPQRPWQGLTQPDPHLTQTMHCARTDRPAPPTSTPGPQPRESPGAQQRSSPTTTQANSGGHSGALASEARSGLGRRAPRISHFASGSPARWAGWSILGASFFFTAKQLIFLIDWRRGSGRGESGGVGRERCFCKRHKGSPQTACGRPGTPLPQSLQPRPWPEPRPQSGGGLPGRNERIAEVWRQPDQCARRKEDRGEGGEREREAGRGERKPGRAGELAAGAARVGPGRAAESQRGSGWGSDLTPAGDDRAPRNTKKARRSLAPTRSPRPARHWPSPARGARRIFDHKDPTRTERKQPPRAFAHPCPTPYRALLLSKVKGKRKTEDFFF